MSGAEPFLIAAAVASVASTAVGGVNAYQQASYQSDALKAQAEQDAADASSEAQQSLESGARNRLISEVGGQITTNTGQ